MVTILMALWRMGSSFEGFISAWMVCWFVGSMVYGELLVACHLDWMVA
jgi:hypothetical protein